MTASLSTPPVTPAPKLSLKDRFKALMSQYGKMVLWVYFTLFFLVLAGFAVAIRLGFNVKGAGGSMGILAGAWVATKLTQPLRILATLALTPLVERVTRRFRRTPA